jgi:hypothetical protein
MGSRALKGDARSTTVYLNALGKMGLLDDADAPGTEPAIRGGRGISGLLPALAKAARPSDALFENLDDNLLSQTEQIELSHLAEVIDDADGDITTGTADFERVKYLVNKGRGKGITAH